MEQELIYTNMVGSAIDDLVELLGSPDCVVLTDVNTAQFVLPVLVNDSRAVASAGRVTVRSGDANKTLDELAAAWRRLAELSATRKTLVINIGGGVVTDLGGLAAATFKRGLRCINVPTTLLGAVDASIGGKTGINFNGVKNLIGTFTEPIATVISTVYFNTLPPQQILSGYAEMIKHGLLEDPDTFRSLLAYSPVYPSFNSEALLPLIQKSVLTKKRICEADLLESGLRKALNFGHTVGHAFEALALRRQSPVLHGYAVAWGMVTELILSHLALNFPSEYVHSLSDYVRTNYGMHALSCSDYPELLDLMRQDKKTLDATHINFTLLESIGKPRIDCTASDDQIKTALDLYRDLSGQ